MAERLRILGSIRRRGAGRLASRLAGLENQNQAIAANAPSGANSLGALVIGGGIRGLSIAGSLGHRGIPVWVMTTGNDRLATLSRYTRRPLPWITGSPEEQVEYLLRLAREHHLDGWALFPTADEPAAFLSRFRRELATRFRVTTPDWDVLRWAYDKRLTYQLAAQESVDHPWTLCPASEADLEAVDGRFPVILKPAVKANANRFTADKAWPAESRDRLLARYREARTVGPPEIHGRAGVRWVRMIAEVPAAFQEILRGRLRVADYLRSFRSPLEFALSAADDPWPGLLDMPIRAHAFITKILDNGKNLAGKANGTLAEGPRRPKLDEGEQRRRVWQTVTRSLAPPWALLTKRKLRRESKYKNPLPSPIL